jgi:hypothetical protein
MECAVIIENCSEVDDKGLWAGLAPLPAIRSMAFYTYRDEVVRQGEKMIREAMKE